MRANPSRLAARRCLPVAMLVAAATLSGCKSLTEKYIALEVWKYEKLFGHLPPGFVPPGAMPPAAAPGMRPCGQPQACQPPCGGGVAAAPGHCDPCQGGSVEGGLPPGAVVSPGVPAGALPAGPGGSPGPSAGLPTPAAMTSSRPVVISDEVVLP